MSKKIFTGKVTGHYKNGQLRIEENYEDGKLDGIRNSYYENGLVRKRRKL